MVVTYSLTDVLSAIVLNSQSLSDRLNVQSFDDLVLNNLLSETQPGKPDIQSSRLEQWCEIAAKGDQQRFHQRLAWDHLDETTLKVCLSNSYDRLSVMPAWGKTLQRIVEASQSIANPLDRTPYSFVSHDAPHPFEEILAPWVQVAQQHLLRQTAHYNRLLSQSAQVALERQLLYLLARLCAATLMHEFAQFRSSGDTLKDFLILSVVGRTSREKYQAFLNHLFKDGFVSFFQRYSVLARLVATTIDFWVASTTEFLERLDADWPMIQQQFSPDQPLTKVADFKPGVSDSHNCGRTVILLKFDTDLKLVYKPKDLGLETAFCQLLDWFNQQEIDLAFKSPQVLEREGYGWVEYIASLPCQSKAEVQRFYGRSGMLLCLIHAFQGTDYHYENLIAHGEFPVLVDMETILSPQFATNMRQQNVSNPTNSQFARSVLRTGFLPSKEFLLPGEQHPVDMSGFGATETQNLTQLTWYDINADGMRLGYTTICSEPNDNLPILNGNPQSPEDYLEALVDGFEVMYRWLLSHRNELLSDDSPLTSFNHQTCRLVFRNTRIYASILMQSYVPELLQYGVDRSIGLDVLSRAFMVSNEKPDYWPMLAAESQAMEQGDIPFFTVSTANTQLLLPTGLISLDPDASIFDAMLAHIQALSKADLAFQLKLIRLSYASRFMQEPLYTYTCSLETDKSLTATITNDPPQIQSRVTPDKIVKGAIALAEQLKQQAVMLDKSSTTWFGVGHGLDKQTFYPQSLTLNLYDGSCGVALFLSALAKITGDTQWRDLAMMSLSSFRQVFQDNSSDTLTSLFRYTNIGGGTGLGSILYTFTRIAQFLDEPSLLLDAQQVSSLITFEKISNDQTFDIIRGAAGAILGLLTLHEHVEASNHKESLLEKAITCGQHLLKYQTGENSDCQAWTTWRGKQLTGFSQGAAGIAYALIRLFELTKRSEFLDAAKKGIAYEQTQFLPTLGNWADLRFSESSCQISWAHGAPGIGLARLGGLPYVENCEIHMQIENALKTTQNALIWGVDSLCWGTLGRLETLLVASQVLDRPSLWQVVEQTLASRIDYTDANNQLILFDTQQPEVCNPGFFHGISGIGYELLRITYPEQLPSVLLWQ